MKEVQSVVEIFPKFLFLHRCRKVNICGGDNSKIDFNFFCATKACEFLCLKDTQEFHLRLRRHFAYLIQEQCAAVGLFKHTTPIAGCTGKRSFHVSEDFTLKQVFVGEHAAVDGFEGSALTRTTVADHLCDDLFANTCFACDEDSRLRRCEQIDQTLNLRCGVPDKCFAFLTHGLLSPR